MSLSRKITGETQDGISGKAQQNSHGLSIEGTELLHYSPQTEVSSSLGQMTPDTGSGSDKNASDMGGFEDLNQTFELKPISQPSSHTSQYAVPYNEEFETAKGSFEGKREHGSRRKDSFMLYTPDEERAVVKRLDIRLVLFVALLYMLSFLDRSSMHIRSLPCSLAQYFQISVTQKSPASLPIYGSIRRNMNGS